jgi:hypothetical protein
VRIQLALGWTLHSHNYLRRVRLLPYPGGVHSTEGKWTEWSATGLQHARATEGLGLWGNGEDLEEGTSRENRGRMTITVFWGFTASQVWG